MKILMVCLGNICRSPMAEGILQTKIAEAGLAWRVESAGTGGWHTGQPPHSLSQKVAARNGIVISSQKCRQFIPADMLNYDLIFCMDEDNLSDIVRIAGKFWLPGKTFLLMDALYPGEERSVPDPYYGTENDFHDTFKLISDACDAIIVKYRNQ